MSCGATAMSRGHLQRATAAADFYRSRRVPERIEEALNSIYHRGKDDVYGQLCNFFAELSDPPVISGVIGRKVLDGGGRAAVEAEVVCTLRTIDKRVCAAVACVDSGPAPLRTCEEAEEAERRRLETVEAAITWIQEAIGPSLRGLDPRDQGAIDQRLSDYYRVKKQEEAESERAPSPTVSPPTPAPSPPASKKKASGKGKKAAGAERPVPPSEPQEAATRGAVAVAAVSLAVVKSCAALRDIPLYSHIAAVKHQQAPPELRTPTPLISLLSCPRSSPGKLNLMKEILVIPTPGSTVAQSLDLTTSLQTQILKQLETQSKGGSLMRSVSPLGCLVLACDRLEQPLELIGDACEQLGLELGRHVSLGINCAAHEIMDDSKGRYEVVSGAWRSPDEMVDLYVDLVTRHAAIIALVDPLRKEDRPQWETLGKAVGSRCYLMADVASRSVTSLLQGSSAPVCSGPVLRLTNETTVSDLLAAVRLIEGARRLAVLGSSEEESAEDGVVDLAVGLGVRFIKLGGLLRGERTAKYNRLLAIEEELTRRGMLGRGEEFHFPDFWNNQRVPDGEEEAKEKDEN